MIGDNNRRQSVRVMDKVLISFSLVPPAEYKKIVDEFNRGVLPSKRQGAYDIETYIGTQNALQRLRERDEDLADFLQHLDSKLNMVLTKLQHEPSPMDGLSLLEVSLSGNGIAFAFDRAFELDDVLALDIVLLPGYSHISCYGQVVDCTAQDSGTNGKSYRIALEFSLIMEDDREKLLQHSFKLQSLFLRNRMRND